MKMYRVKTWQDIIEEVEIIKETKRMVVYSKYGREWKENKETNDVAWFHTEEEAIDWLLNYWYNKIEGTRRRLRQDIEQYDKLMILYKRVKIE